MGNGESIAVQYMVWRGCVELSQANQMNNGGVLNALLAAVAAVRSCICMTELRVSACTETRTVSAAQIFQELLLARVRHVIIHNRRRSY